MPTDTSTTVEDEYFLKLDMEKIKDLRGKLDKTRSEENEKQKLKAHWMKCPKCGSDLEEIKYDEVMIDRCTGCDGIWLDKGELELLTQGEAKFTKGLIQRLFT